MLQLLQVLHIRTVTNSTTLQLHDNYNYNYDYNYNITTSTTSTSLQLQIQLQLLHYTTLHRVVSEVTIATIATTSKGTTPATFRSISGFALPSLHHNNSPLLYCPSLETSAIALCGTTGKWDYHSMLSELTYKWQFG